MPCACAEDTPDGDRSLRESLPLFEKNRCVEARDPAGQLFCGDPRLAAAGVRLGVAVQDRLNRIADRGPAIEENVEWTRSRDLSCGIFGTQRVAGQRIESVKACLLKETEERIAILSDPDFDCLAANTSAGALICSDPSLAIADKGLNDYVLTAIGKLKNDETKAAFDEYARWTRARDRLCRLADKDNVPLTELSSSETCIADYLRQKTAEIVSAKGDPKKIFGRSMVSPSPDADAVDLCVAQIHSANACGDFLGVSHIIQIDTEVSAQEALVTAEVEMKVLSPFSVCSPVASNCTGTCWDLASGQAGPVPRSRENLPISHRLRIEKSFAFRKTENGNWRCNAGTLQPVELGIALSGP